MGNVYLPAVFDISTLPKVHLEGPDAECAAVELVLGTLVDWDDSTEVRKQKDNYIM